MNELLKKHKLFFIILAVLFIGFLLWYFATIVVFILLAGVISVIGNPVVSFLDKIRWGRVHIPRGLSVLVTLLLICAVLLAFLSFFIPLVIREIQLISAIDVNQLLSHYKNDIDGFHQVLVKAGLVNPNETLDVILEARIKSLLDLAAFSSIVKNILTFTGNFFFGAFSVLFLSFFFMYDRTLFARGILMVVPDEYHEHTRNVLMDTKKLLARYFIGLLIDVFAMAASYTAGFGIIGIKGAFVIGIFGGVINIVPYVGPIIATITGVVLGATGVLSTGDYTLLLPLVLKILIVMVTVILIDNVLYQPVIFGKSVKAHPVEIFLVIIAAGSIGGIPGMIVAVPAYSVLRIIAREFFSQFRLIQKLTRKI